MNGNRARVEAERLTDGSFVYNVTMDLDPSPLATDNDWQGGGAGFVTFACVDADHAYRLARELDACVGAS